MNALAKKYKLFIVITLAILVVGMTLFGIFGFNQAVDYKDGYEVRVSVEQKAGNSLTVLESATEEYFAKEGIKPIEYATQKMDEGKTLVYKFNKDVKIDEDALAAHIQSKLDADSSITNLTATADYNSVVGYKEFKAGYLLLAVSVAVVAIFVYTVIMEKLSGAVATVGASVLAALAFVALMAITRLPAYPVVGVTIALAMVSCAVLACATVARCKEEYKNAAQSKPDTWQIADKVMSSEKKKYVFTLVAFLIAALAISAFIAPYMMFVGGQILLAGATACTVSYFVAPLLWAAVKAKAKK